MKLFLQAKHWQLFLLLYIPPYFIRSPFTMFIILSFFLTITSLWVLSVGIASNRNNNMKPNSFFKHVFIICCIFMPLFWIFLNISPIFLKNNVNAELLLGNIKLAFSIGFILTSVYMLLYASKSLGQSAFQNTKSFVKYILLILALIVLPIGIWFIQPRVNKMHLTT